MLYITDTFKQNTSAFALSIIVHHTMFTTANSANTVLILFITLTCEPVVQYFFNFIKSKYTNIF